MKTGVELIVAERTRQIEKEGWSAEHDDEHGREELAQAAAVYAAPCQIFEMCGDGGRTLVLTDIWPFDDEWDKRTHKYTGAYDIYRDEWLKKNKARRIKELTKAGALIAAEIDRIQRLTEDPTQ